jgi:hypothetical protein
MNHCFELTDPPPPQFSMAKRVLVLSELTVPGWWLQQRSSLQIVQQFFEAQSAPLGLKLAGGSSMSSFYINNATFGISI